jgi:hypothetical protein
VHPNYCKADQWSSKVIGAAIEVHRLKGAGLLESIYQKCLARELSLNRRSQRAPRLENPKSPCALRELGVFLLCAAI